MRFREIVKKILIKGGKARGRQGEEDMDRRYRGESD
jgi:hypothetical protein